MCVFVLGVLGVSSVCQIFFELACFGEVFLRKAASPSNRSYSEMRGLVYFLVLGFFILAVILEKNNYVRYVILAGEPLSHYHTCLFISIPCQLVTEYGLNKQTKMHLSAF